MHRLIELTADGKVLISLTGSDQDDVNLTYDTTLPSGTDVFYYRVIDNRTDMPRFSKAAPVYIHIGEGFQVTKGSTKMPALPAPGLIFVLTCSGYL